MTDKTQPAAHAEITAPISADLRGIDDAGAKSAPITFMTEDRACTWAWDQVREDVGTEGWTAGDSCNFHGFFLWGWNYRGQYETQRPAAPPAPAAVAVPELRLTDEQIEQACISARDEFMLREVERTDKKLRLAFGRAVLHSARAALAAAPAQLDLRKHLRWALQLLRNDEGGCCGQRHSEAVHALERADAMAAWGQEPAAPAHAVAAPDHRAAFEMAYAFAWHKHRQGQEKVEELAAEIVSWREGNTYGEDLPRLRFGWEGYQWALATAPVQEHATQLAGQGQDKP